VVADFVFRALSTHWECGKRARTACQRLQTAVYYIENETIRKKAKGGAESSRGWDTGVAGAQT